MNSAYVGATSLTTGSLTFTANGTDRYWVGAYIQANTDFLNAPIKIYM
jgi:hypothetical protein